MMTIQQLTQHVTTVSHFERLKDYSDFSRAVLDFLSMGLQAEIVCQNEHNYKFFQYKEDCDYNISRPVNADLFYKAEEFESALKKFKEGISLIRRKESPSVETRVAFSRMVYTLQQSIAVSLDALPASSANQAKKINGELFERLIRILMREVGVDCQSGVLRVPVCDGNGEQVHVMNYQHDLVARKDEKIVFLGSVKTSSKDRLDKIFVDKLLYSKFTNSDTPYIAVFLNDVQRAKSSTLGRYKINSTFLSGHFKAYTLKLAALDGVFYCDLRPSMKTDPFLASHIGSIDKLFFDEIKAYIS